LDENFEPADHNVWRGPSRKDRLRDPWCWTWNVYRRSLVRPLLLARQRPARTPPSTFLFLL